MTVPTPTEIHDITMYVKPARSHSPFADAASCKTDFTLQHLTRQICL
jgi:hypothetical protein